MNTSQQGNRKRARAQRKRKRTREEDTKQREANGDERAGQLVDHHHHRNGNPTDEPGVHCGASFRSRSSDMEKERPVVLTIEEHERRAMENRPLVYEI